MAGPTLANLIQNRREDILSAWLERVLVRPGTHYRERPEAQLTSWFGAGMDALLQSLSTGSDESLEAHASAIGASRQRLGFNIDEVVDALLLLKEVVAGMVLEAWEDDPQLRNRAAATLDRNLRSLVSCFTAHFAGALRRQEQRISTLEERQRLARELHDAVSQSLYAVHLHAGAASRLLASSDTAGAGANLEQLQGAARQALADMRLLIYELRPSALPQQGLELALRARLAAVEARVGLSASCQIEPGLALESEVEEAIYGLACEALNNALKHAEAHQVSLSLGREDERLVLTVCDDGRGFAGAGAAGGLGLTGMRERAAALGAELRIDSAPGRGTTVRVELDLQRARGATP